MTILKEKKHKHFKNGTVYALETLGGYPVEVTDTFLPFYTKDCINEHSNKINTNDIGSREERWMIGVSVMSGCPVRCKFCATGKLSKVRNLDWTDIIAQINFIFDKNPNIDPQNSKEFKINFTRMGEPFLNMINVKEAVRNITIAYPKAHCYISTIGLKNADYSWIKDNITLQLSIHALSDDRRDFLIPSKQKASLEELGQIRTKSNLKTTINLTLVDNNDFDIKLLTKYFDPNHFFIKLSPLNKNVIAETNNLDGIIKQINNI